MIAGAANAILLWPRAGCLDVLVLLTGTVLVSRDGGDSWSEWPVELPAGTAATAVAAPQGLAPGAPLLVGLDAGGVLRV